MSLERDQVEYSGCMPTALAFIAAVYSNVITHNVKNTATDMPQSYHQNYAEWTVCWSVYWDTATFMMK